LSTLGFELWTVTELYGYLWYRHTAKTRRYSAAQIFRYTLLSFPYLLSSTFLPFYLSLQLFFHIFLISLFSPRKLTQTVTFLNSIFVVSGSTVGRNTKYSETFEFFSVHSSQFQLVMLPTTPFLFLQILIFSPLHTYKMLTTDRH